VWLNVLESITQSVTDRGGVIAMVLKELAKWRGTASPFPSPQGGLRLLRRSSRQRHGGEGGVGGGPTCCTGAP
jgi:hypothetical protein